MSFPISDLVALVVSAALVASGVITWWRLSRSVRGVQYALQPLPMLALVASKPANEVDEERAPDSSIRLRPGARLRAVDSH